MTRGGLVFQSLAAVDLDALHGYLLSTLSTDLRLRPSERSHHDRPVLPRLRHPGRGQRDYSDCQAALAHVPARMTALPFLGTEDEVIAKTRDADALVTSASPVTCSVMQARSRGSRSWRAPGGLRRHREHRRDKGPVDGTAVLSTARLSRPILAFRPRPQRGQVACRRISGGQQISGPLARREPPHDTKANRPRRRWRPERVQTPDRRGVVGAQRRRERAPRSASSRDQVTSDQDRANRVGVFDRGNQPRGAHRSSATRRSVRPLTPYGHVQPERHEAAVEGIGSLRKLNGQRNQRAE